MSLNLFHYSDYKAYVQQRIRALPRAGRGELKAIARHLRVHTSLLSQVLKGERDLTAEQACLLTGYFSLTPLEADYFITLVQLNRAGTPALRAHVERSLARLRAQAGSDSGSPDQPLGEADRAQFYSNWYYSGIRLLTTLPGFATREAIAERYALPLPLVVQVVEFLLGTGLIRETEGRLQIGPRQTQLAANSPLLTRHLTNWRLKGMERMPRKHEGEFFFAAPLALSHADAAQIRAWLLELGQKMRALLDESEPETLMCLNMDWFEF